MNSRKAMRKIQDTTLELSLRKQLPSALVHCIMRLKYDTCTEEQIKFLSELSSHYLRVVQYYAMYPAVEKESNELIKKAIAESKLF